ncbi:hypothetical protein B0T21DRAFT_19193 [Apiosordaria backusii]|uniref:Uncharacterized protein n=1 Tax=Apiosordaria backusii TaxID=314023 RepID=A0AA40EZ71_9PEZI|nr:hypothetical protein B0T21DRAFT_19193 [Apiosordaria backusii]
MILLTLSFWNLTSNRSFRAISTARLRTMTTGPESRKPMTGRLWITAATWPPWISTLMMWTILFWRRIWTISFRRPQKLLSSGFQPPISLDLACCIWKAETQVMTVSTASFPITLIRLSLATVPRIKTMTASFLRFMATPSLTLATSPSLRGLKSLRRQNYTYPRNTLPMIYGLAFFTSFSFLLTGVLCLFSIWLFRSHLAIGISRRFRPN